MRRYQLFRYADLQWFMIARKKFAQWRRLIAILCDRGWWPAPRRTGPDEPQYCRRPKSWPTRTCPRFLAGS